MSVSLLPSTQDIMGDCRQQIACFVTVALLLTAATGSDVFLEWNVEMDISSKPTKVHQFVISINGMLPGPLINVTTNDIVHINIFNNLEEPFLMTWNGLQQRGNSWQDGVSGTNCPIQPGHNWTYVFQPSDQSGSFFYFPSIKKQRAIGGYGPIRINNPDFVPLPYPKPEAEFDLLIGDWFNPHSDLKFDPDIILMNAKAPYKHPLGKSFELFNVTEGKTYMLRISNVGSSVSLNFRIQNHTMVLVETEGSYTNYITLDSLDVHVGQSYSVLVTADQDDADYYMAASITQESSGVGINGVGVLHYGKSVGLGISNNSFPYGPDPTDRTFSVGQAKAITGFNFNITNIKVSQTFILQTSIEHIRGRRRYAVNNVSYLTPNTPLKLADYFVNGTGVYQLDVFPTDSVNKVASYGASVVSGTYNGWIEIIFKNNLDHMDSWHLDGHRFYVVGFGEGNWSRFYRSNYNVWNPVRRSTVQVYPGGWTAVYVFMDNPGMWNLRSQRLDNWSHGQELYIRVFVDSVRDRNPPSNLLLCGIFGSQAPAPAPTPNSDPYRYLRSRHINF